jgi:hypothetical protein
MRSALLSIALQISMKFSYSLINPDNLLLYSNIFPRYQQINRKRAGARARSQHSSFLTAYGRRELVGEAALAGASGSAFFLQKSRLS